MKRLKSSNLIIASAVLALWGTVASAATLTGLFDVTAYNVTNLNGFESKARKSNFDAAKAGTLGSTSSSITSATFTYNGSLNFSKENGSQDAPYTIGEWLTTGTGTNDLNPSSSFAQKQLSQSLITAGTATTTFFLFEYKNELAATDFLIRHDDGIAVFDDAFEDVNLLGGNEGPTYITESLVSGFDGGKPIFLYAATNGNPSVLQVSAVPLPAAAWLFGSALLAGGVIGRRKKKRPDMPSL